MYLHTLYFAVGLEGGMCSILEICLQQTVEKPIKSTL